MKKLGIGVLAILLLGMAVPSALAADQEKWSFYVEESTNGKVEIGESTEIVNVDRKSFGVLKDMVHYVRVSGENVEGTCFRFGKTYGKISIDGFRDVFCNGFVDDGIGGEYYVSKGTYTAVSGWRE